VEENREGCCPVSLPVSPLRGRSESTIAGRVRDDDDDGGSDESDDDYDGGGGGKW
jgi:hypothetical protein